MTGDHAAALLGRNRHQGRHLSRQRFGVPMRLWEGEYELKPVKIRVASNDFRATCNLCHTAFTRGRSRCQSRWRHHARVGSQHSRGVAPQRCSADNRAPPRLAARSGREARASQCQREDRRTGASRGEAMAVVRVELADNPTRGSGVVAWRCGVHTTVRLSPGSGSGRAGPTHTHAGGASGRRRTVKGG